MLYEYFPLNSGVCGCCAGASGPLASCYHFPSTRASNPHPAFGTPLPRDAFSHDADAVYSISDGLHFCVEQVAANKLDHLPLPIPTRRVTACCFNGTTDLEVRRTALTQ